MAEYPKTSDLYRYSKNMSPGPEFVKGKVYADLKVEDFSDYGASEIRPVRINGLYNFISPIKDDYKNRRLNIFVDTSGVIVDSYYF